MKKQESKAKYLWNQVKRFWNYVWHGEDMLSWVLSIIVAFIIIKFIFYPLIGVVLGTSYPIVAVVSGSMEHKIVEEQNGNVGICGNQFEEKERLNLEEYWQICGNWYEERNISQEQFKEFSFSNGIDTGDVILLRNPGTKNLVVGDIIVFIQEQNPSKEPIIHRITNIKEINDQRVFQTKGDHNADQINVSTRSKYLNELEITETQVIGKAIFSIPYVGYIKIWAYQFMLFIRGII